MKMQQFFKGEMEEVGFLISNERANVFDDSLCRQISKK